MKRDYVRLLFWQDHTPQRESLPPLARPPRDWSVMAAASALILFAIFIFAGALYWSSAQAPIGVPAATAVKMLTPQKLDALLSHYGALAQEHAMLLQTAPAFADPAQSK